MRMVEITKLPGLEFQGEATGGQVRCVVGHHVEHLGVLEEHLTTGGAIANRRDEVAATPIAVPIFPGQSPQAVCVAMRNRTQTTTTPTSGDPARIAAAAGARQATAGSAYRDCEKTLL